MSANEFKQKQIGRILRCVGISTFRFNKNFTLETRFFAQETSLKRSCVKRFTGWNVVGQCGC